MDKSSFPGERKYNRFGGRPGLNVDFEAVCDAVLGAWQGNGDTITAGDSVYSLETEVRGIPTY